MANITVKYTNQLLTEAGTKIKIFEATNPHVHFVQNKTCTQAGVAVQPYGVVMIPDPLFDTDITYTLQAVLNGTTYTATASAVAAVTIGNNLTMSTS